MTAVADQVVTLGHRITRISHVVVNVSDLERSREFYESLTPLRVVATLDAPRQRFGGLDIDEGEFRGYVLDDGTAGAPIAVHLVQWTTPEPVGKPYEVFWNVGLAKLGFCTNLPWQARVAGLEAAGIPLTNARVVRNYVSFTDPDGTILSFYPARSTSVRYDHLAHTNPSVIDIDRSIRYYRDVLGLDLHLDAVPTEPMPASQGPGSDVSQWDSHHLAARGDRRFSVDLSQYHYPEPTAESLLPYPEAHHLGISRIGFEVDDLDAAAALLRAGDAIGASRVIGEPETWNLGGDVGTRRVLSFRDPDDIRLEFVEKPPRAPSTSLRFSATAVLN